MIQPVSLLVCYFFVLGFVAAQTPSPACLAMEAPLVLDQACDNPSQGPLAINGGLAMSFEPAWSSRISVMQFQLQAPYTGCCSSYNAFSWTVRIYDSGGNLLASNTKSETNGGPISTNMTFTPFFVTANAQYSWSLTCNGYAGYSCAMKYECPYSRGQTPSYSGNIWTLPFRTFMPPFINSCTLNNGGCPAGSNCVSTSHCANTCTCNTGYTYDSVTGCTPINNCITNNGGCGSNSNCMYTGPATNICNCVTGYSSSNGANCNPINNCLTNNGGCGTFSTCTNSGPGTNTCNCASLYLSPYGNGTACAPINNCLTSNGGCGAFSTCTFTGPATNTCGCNNGYNSTTSNGKNCVAINNCLTNNGNCGGNSTCFNTGPGLNACQCFPGFSGTLAGINCVAINNCQSNNGGCGLNSRCTYTGPATSSCACNSGYFGLINGTNCALITFCSPGSYQTAAATLTSNTVCVQCAAGYSCAGLQSAPLPCGSNNFYSSAGQSVCSTVSVGYYSTGGTLTTRTGQTICTAGTICNAGIQSTCPLYLSFTSTGGQVTCTPCTICSTGLSINQDCTITSDRTCKDISPPVLVVSGPSVIVLEAVLSSFVAPAYTAIDSYSGNLTSSVTHTAYPTTAAIGTFSITYKVSDPAGNNAAVTIQVFVEDTTAPTLTLLGDSQVTVEAGNSFKDLSATAVDAVDGNVTSRIKTYGLAAVMAAVQAHQTGMYTIQYAVSDSNNNEASIVTRTVIIQDTLPPIITLHGPSVVVVQAAKIFTPYADLGATAVDLCDGNVSVQVFGAQLVDITQITNYTITYIAFDAAGNNATASRTVVVVDGTAPVLSLLGPAHCTLEANSVWVELGAVAHDNYDSDNDVSNFITISGQVNETAPVGSVFSLVYTVSDFSNNDAIPVTRTVTIVDTVPPTLTLIGNPIITILYGSVFVDDGALAQDAVDGPLMPIVTNPVTSSSAPFTYYVIYQAKDAAGNSASISRTVIVTDTTAPVIKLIGDPTQVVEAAGTPYIELGATAFDNFNGELNVTVAGSVNMTPPWTPYSFTLSYSTTDSSSNMAVAYRIVTVYDTTPPVITLIGTADLSVEGGAAYNDQGATAWDSLDLNVTDEIQSSLSRTTLLRGVWVTQSVSEFNTTLPGGSFFTITYTVSDLAGNTAIPVSRKITVVDHVPPVVTIIGPKSFQLQGQCPSTSYSFSNFTIIDNLDGDVTSRAFFKVAIDSSSNIFNLSDIDTCLNPTGTVFSVYVYGSDDSGNIATPQVLTLTLVDTIPPVISLNVYVYSDTRAQTFYLPSDNSLVVLYVGEEYVEPGATVTDSYDQSPNPQMNLVVTGDVFNATVAGEATTVHYQTHDSSGNKAFTVRNVRVVAAPKAAAATTAVTAGSSAVVAVVVIIVIVLFIVLLVRQSRRTKRFAESHRNILSAHAQNPLVLHPEPTPTDHMYESIYEQRVKVYQALQSLKKPPISSSFTSNEAPASESTVQHYGEIDGEASSEYTAPEAEQTSSTLQSSSEAEPSGYDVMLESTSRSQPQSEGTQQVKEQAYTRLSVHGAPSSHAYSKFSVSSNGGFAVDTNLDSVTEESEPTYDGFVVKQLAVDNTYQDYQDAKEPTYDGAHNNLYDGAPTGIYDGANTLTTTASTSRAYDPVSLIPTPKHQYDDSGPVEDEVYGFTAFAAEPSSLYGDPDEIVVPEKSGTDENDMSRYYHGAIDRVTSERLLMNNGVGGTYLVRARETPNSFAFSVLHKGKIIHRLIETGVSNNVYTIDRKRTLECSSLSDAVNILREEMRIQHGYSQMIPLSPLNTVDNIPDSTTATTATTTGKTLTSFSSVTKILPVENSYLHGAITRIVAENRLIQAGATDGLFLVRDSSEGSIVLSATFHGRVYNFKFEVRGNNFIGGDGKLYSNISQIVNSHYDDKGDFPALLMQPCPPPATDEHDA